MYFLLFSFSTEAGIFIIPMQNAWRETGLQKEQIAAGEKNLTLPVVIPETEYAALKGLADLDAADRYAWNNAAMAAYYQVESIIGVAE